jgi:non-canonical (house-cleaning) NTP pyrophosphatase
VGLESGLIKTPLIETEYMNVCACSIYNGKKYYMGLSPAFEMPKEITDLVISNNIEIDEAVFRAGFSDNHRIGYSQGIIGILTNGKVNRKDYMKPAVTMALIRINNI